MSDARMLTTEEISERLKLHIITVQRWLRTGKLQGIKLPGKAGWRVPIAEVERLERGE